MKLTMTKQRTSLDSKRLDALMRISYRQEKSSDVELHEVIDIWKGKKDRHITYKVDENMHLSKDFFNVYS